ncbi:MAG: thiamine ABC transporter substrate-binding protein [Cardiobacteriaceae bacterium]|nr:thiamine ABC transporter substrate-binding protein [Cardiobacteriaceae bacterium]
MKKLTLLALAIMGMAHAKNLTILTYSSFNSDWGPAPKLSALFEKECACKIDWVSSEDSVMMLRRLQLEGKALDADIILGLDNQSVGEALLTEHVAPLKQATTTRFGETQSALPFDFGYLAFIKRKDAKLPHFASLKDFAEYQEPLTIAIQDPRSSSVGSSFLAWTHADGNDSKALWQALRPKIKAMTSGWSEAYGMFTKNHVDTVLSYTTSPLYHELVENDTQYEAILFDAPHYEQIEYAIVLKHAKEADLAQQFMQFLISPAAQKELALNNWMYPVVDGVDLPKAFKNAKQPKGINFSSQETAEKMPKWLEQWRADYLN